MPPQLCSCVWNSIKPSALSERWCLHHGAPKGKETRQAGREILEIHHMKNKLVYKKLVSGGEGMVTPLVGGDAKRFSHCLVVPQ